MINNTLELLTLTCGMFQKALLFVLGCILLIQVFHTLLCAHREFGVLHSQHVVTPNYDVLSHNQHFALLLPIANLLHNYFHGSRQYDLRLAIRVGLGKNKLQPTCERISFFFDQVKHVYIQLGVSSLLRFFLIFLNLIARSLDCLRNMLRLSPQFPSKSLQYCSP